MQHVMQWVDYGGLHSLVVMIPSTGFRIAPAKIIHLFQLIFKIIMEGSLCLRQNSIKMDGCQLLLIRI